MTAKQLFSKTLPFVWAKLIVGILFVGVSIVLFAILMALGWLFGKGRKEQPMPAYAGAGNANLQRRSSYCRYCGRQNDSRMSYCSSCGNNL